MDPGVLSHLQPPSLLPAGSIPLRAAPARRLCTDCGVSRMSDPSQCASACQFIRPAYETLEARVHGRARGDGDERFFGVTCGMWRARLREPAAGAQWSGITTAIAARLLEDGEVDAVLTVRGDPADRWRPEPVLVRRAEDLAECRGMRMGFAPLLALIEPAIAQGVRRLAVIAIPCQVHALRALEPRLGLESLIVIGTPCSDNTTTERFHQFLARLDPDPASIRYLEFRADYQVELRHDDGRRRTIPFIRLPIADLGDDFFPTTCRTCVDYTNSLADVVVGYMGGTGRQWVIARNDTGLRVLDRLGDALEREAPASAGRRAPAVQGFMRNLQRAAGGLPVNRAPAWLRPLLAWLMPRVGPRGLEFARARVEMKAVESVIQLRRNHPRRVRAMVPAHVWKIARPYGLTPTDAERAPASRPAESDRRTPHAA